MRGQGGRSGGGEGPSRPWPMSMDKALAWLEVWDGGSEGGGA